MGGGDHDHRGLRRYVVSINTKQSKCKNATSKVLILCCQSAWVQKLMRPILDPEVKHRPTVNAMPGWSEFEVWLIFRENSFLSCEHSSPGICSRSTGAAAKQPGSWRKQLGSILRTEIEFHSKWNFSPQLISILWEQNQLAAKPTFTKSMKVHEMQICQVTTSNSCKRWFWWQRMKANTGCKENLVVL